MSTKTRYNFPSHLQATAATLLKQLLRRVSFWFVMIDPALIRYWCKVFNSRVEGRPGSFQCDKTAIILMCWIKND